MDNELIEYTLLYWFEVVTIFLLFTIAWRVFDMLLHALIPRNK